MPFTNPCPFNASPLQLTANRPVQRLGRMRRLRTAQAVASALGLLLCAPLTTFALELGEASIKSGLGQSLHVQIPYRLAGNEQLSSTCIGLVPARRAADALPTYTRVSRISITPTHIEIFDERGVREPLIGLNVDVHCNTAARFVRSYQLFVDPPARMPTILASGTEGVAPARASAIDAAPVATRDSTASITTSTTSTATARATPTARARGHAGGDVTQGQTYRVVRGDTLSGIAARVTERPTTILETANAIFAANPQAFARGNRDLLEEGRSITIPLLTPATAVLAPTDSAPAPLPAVRAAELHTVAPVPAAASIAAPMSTTQTPPADGAATAVAAAAIQPLPAPVAVMEPSADPAPVATRIDSPTETPSAAVTGPTSGWLVTLLALGGILLLSAPLAFVRRRSRQPAQSDARRTAPKPVPRERVEPAAGIEVVEERTPSDRTATVRSAKIEVATDPEAASTSNAKTLALTVDPADAVDLDVGTPIANENAAGLADRANSSPFDDTVGNESLEENAATARLPADAAIDDEQMTLTVVEIDMLRQDYEAEHTLTQQASQTLRDALADLKATKAARAAAAEAATMELPQQSTDTADSAANAPTARVKMK